jgi:DNA invertase Pin-like site-specific DNA recombinase
MQSVVIGQVWSLLNLRHFRVEFLVERIANAPELRAFGRYVGSTRDKEISFTVSALSRGLRGARLVRDADGREPYRPPTDKIAADLDSDATASDFRRTTEPKGFATTSPRMEEAFRMRDQGLSPAEIAKVFGVSRSLVSSWCQRVQQKIYDDRVRQRMERKTGT